MAKRERSEEDEEERESWSSTSTAKKMQISDDINLLEALMMLDVPAEDGDPSAGILFSPAENDGGEGGARVRFTEDPYSSSPSGVFQTTASSYVTINGNDETCGSSFSDWDSSVMASVDVTGLGCSTLSGFGGAWSPRGGDFELAFDDVSFASFLVEVLSPVEHCME